MRNIDVIKFIILLMLFGVGCTTSQTNPADTPPTLAGPALLMFYTDN